MRVRWTKCVCFILAAILIAVSVMPVGVSAVTGSEVAENGIYEGSDYANAKKLDGVSTDSYKMSVKLTVKDGQFTNVDAEAEKYKEGSEDFVRISKYLLQEALLKKPATEDTIKQLKKTSLDGRTCATASCTALKQASLAAIHSAPKAGAPEETPGASPTPDATVTPDVTVTPLPDNTGREEFKSGRPKFSAALSGDGKSVTITWSAYPGADSYEVRRRTVGKGGFAAIGTAGKDVLSYTDYKVEPGTTYNYSVVAVSKEWGESDYDRSTKVEVPEAAASPEPGPAKPGKAVIDSVEPTAYNKLTVTWGEVENATGYIVSRSTAKKGTYKKVQTVSADAMSYTDTGLSTGKTYYYKVQAINEAGSETLKGTASAVKSGKCTLGKTTVTVTPEKKKAVVQWEKVDGANGYAVYRSTSKGKGYKAVKTVTKGTTLSFTNTKLKSKKTYYYKVRAYRKVSGKKVYSGYSAVVSAKTL